MRRCRPLSLECNVTGFDRFEFKFRPKRSDFGRKKLRTAETAEADSRDGQERPKRATAAVTELSKITDIFNKTKELNYGGICRSYCGQAKLIAMLCSRLSTYSFSPLLGAQFWSTINGAKRAPPRGKWPALN